MKRVAGYRVARRLSGALVCALLALLCLAGPVSAQSVTFGTPTASSRFGTGITFTQPYSGATVTSASLLVQVPGDLGPTVIPLPTVGSTSLTASLDTSGGEIYPNTPVVAHFEVELGDGTTVEGPDIHITYADDRFTWKQLTGKFVRLHWIQATDAFAQQLLKWADDGVTKAASLFGVAAPKPIDYFLYPTMQAFQQALGQPGTVGGVAFQSTRTCFALVAQGDTEYGAEVLPHEVTHIVFGDAVANPYHNPPRWLDEGFAVYVSVGYDASYRQQVSAAVDSGTLAPLMALTNYFPMDESRIGLAYAESASAVDFMVRKYGQAAVPKLLGAYATGHSDDEAFQTALGVDMAGFDTAWLADNGVTATKYGPQPAPTGPLPPGWNGSGTGPGPTAGPTGTGSPSNPSGQSTNQPGNTAVLLLAGLFAAAGLALLGGSLILLLSPRR
ncbi:MAG: peptidase MA family metallohydrolase [Candidatus Limnocylindrales bacterium]